MDTLLKSFEHFADRQGNTSFFLAHPQAGEILSQVSPQISRLPIHLHSSLEHAQNFLPHEHAVEFVLTPEARIADACKFPRSLTNMWNLQHNEEGDDQGDAPVMSKSQLVGDGIMDGVWHEYNDTLEIHNPDVLIPVGIHPPIQPHSDVEALPLVDQHPTGAELGPSGIEPDQDGNLVIPEHYRAFQEAFGLDLAENDFMDMFGNADFGQRPVSAATAVAHKPKPVKPEMPPDILPQDTDYGQRPAVGTVDSGGLRDLAEYPMFKRDQPAIGHFAQQSPENMARLLIFVVASIKVAWPLMQYYFPLMFDALQTTGTVQYGKEKPLWAPMVIGKIKHIDYIWNNRQTFYAGIMRAVEADQKAGDTGFLVYQKLILIPMLGVPKAGFATQLLIGKYGCIDSVNLNLLNAKAPTHLMTADGAAFKPASQISVPDSGGNALSTKEYRSLISSDQLTDGQKQLVAFLYGALTRQSVGVLKGYVDYLKALEAEGTGTEELWNIWCSVIAHKIHYGGGKKRPLDVVLPNQAKPSRVQAYAAIPRDLLAKSQASVRRDGKNLDPAYGGDVVSGDHRRLIRGESKVLKARARKKA